MPEKDTRPTSQATLVADPSIRSGLLDRREFLSAGALVLAAADSTAMGKPQDALETAAKMLGADTLKSLQFAGSGSSFTVGQNFRPDDPWPAVAIKRYEASINYETASMQIDLLREMGAAMPRGGVPFTGELRQIQAVSGEHAWNVPASAPAPQGGAGPATLNTRPEAGGTAWAGPGGSPKPIGAPESQREFMLMLWATPHGFLKAAMANNATIRNVNGQTQVSFAIDGTYKMIGVIDEHNRVARVQTWIDQSIIGDMLIETDYRDYRDFGGIVFPQRILQKQDGFPSFDLTVASAMANPVVDIVVPDDIRNASPPPITVKEQKVADGVFWLTGGTHHSMAIEMQDHIVLVDTPNGEPRALAVIAKAKELIPGKPVRYVVAMHHHWDHLGGIRTAIDEGATIVTHRVNRALLERAATAPHTIGPDRLSRSNRPLKLQTIDAEGEIADGTRTIKLYTMTNFDHAADMIMVYLPKEKLLVEADAYSPPQTPETPLIPPKILYAAALYENIRRLNLDVERIVPFHGMRMATVSELARQSGRATAATH